MMDFHPEKIWIDGAFHDKQSLSEFFIDPTGEKHVTNKAGEWQKIECNYNDELVFEGGQWRVKNQSDITNALRRRMLDRIDSVAGSARLRFVSSGALIEEEYRAALKAVEQWRAAGSPADAVPHEIVSGAEYSGISHEAAAIEIEQTAAQWESVLSQIRDLRLAGKCAVRKATDNEIVNVAQGYITQLEELQPSA